MKPSPLRANIESWWCNVVTSAADIIMHLIGAAATSRRDDMYRPMVRITSVGRTVNVVSIFAGWYEEIREFGGEKVHLRDTCSVIGN